jgi:hypothetical protein
MTRDEAAVCFARLVAHWPQLGGHETDPLATSRAEDWIRSLTRLDANTAMTAITQTIEQHRYPRAPVFAEIQEAARQVQRHQALEQSTRRALEPGNTTTNRAKVTALIRQAQQAITDAKQRTPEPKTSTPVSKYDEVPIHWGAEGTIMTPEEREAQLEEIGDRKVRRRSP